jgi:cytoskeletal protein CcmA (bactofilin family)
MTISPYVRYSLALAGALLAAGSVRAQEFQELIVKKGILRGDQYLAGGTVDVHGKVEGDLTMAAAQAGLDGIVTGDVAAIGALVHVGGVVGDDVRVLGGRVIVQGSVGDGLLAGGGEVTLTRGTRVGGKAILGGRRVVDLGDVDGDLLAAGQYVEIDGDVRGRTTVRADEVVIGPKARLSGDLVVRSPNPPRIAEGARISGKVILDEIPGPGFLGWLRIAARAAAMQVGLLLVAWSWMVFAPRLSRDAAVLEWRETGIVQGFGFAVVVGLPILAVLLAITVVGIPLAVGVAAIWAVLLLVGYSSTAICLGGWLRARRPGVASAATLGESLLWTLLALLLLRGAEAIPWVGSVVTAGAVFWGAGAVARAAQLAHRRGRVSRGPPGPAAA